MTCKYNFGVIFDLDGVIIDSCQVMEQAFEYSFKKFFPYEDVPFNEYTKHTGKGFLNILKEMGLPSEMYSHFNKKSIELIPEIKVFNGVKDVLTLLKKNNCYLGIATGKDSFKTNLILKNKKLLSYFDKVICNDQVKHGKPYPDPINIHLKNAGLDKRSIIFVGDSIADIQCAHNSKVSSVAVLWGLGRREDLIHENPDYFAYEIDDLKHIFCQVGFIKNEHLISQEENA